MASDNDQIINTEIATLKEKVPQLPGLELVTCVRALVRIQIRLTEYKQLSVCMQFPEKYPQAPLLVELKSKTLGDKLLDRLTKICDDEARKQVGQKQVLILVKFLKQFLEDNPLCSCSEEISHIKRNMLGEGDDLKVKQKTSQILLKLQKNKYFMNLRISVPENYPKESVQVEVSDSNFPKLLRIFFRAQAQEIGRQCVQPPLKKQPNGATFTPQPSLRKVCEFVIMESIKRYPDETCPLCKHKCLPVEPEAALSDRSQHVIRVYCGHIFHFGCMDDYMKTPPFTGGKKCPSCDKRIYHDQWKQSPELAEARWAHKQARARELDEVMDFLQ